MRLKIKPIEKKEFVELLSTTPALDRKWLISFYHCVEMTHLFYLVEEVVGQKTIGLTYSTQMQDHQDFSFIIFPEFQRRGFGKDLIIYIHKNFENATLTVSGSNKRMLGLINKISAFFSLEVTTLDLKRLQFKLN
jgi:ribosomal protein S18 acetylase RimI-like enzyme